tara:strand:- start:3001 stop:3594 length:594 start_codon:yes stop_codon:yes gene_type:complete
MKSKSKKMVAYRFSLETVKILKRFANKRKTTQTAVLETLVDRHCKSIMKTAKILLALLIPVTTNAVEINGALIHAVAMVESNNNHRAVGDQGKANGAFQMWKPAWTDCSRWLKKNGFKTTPYEKGVNDPTISHQYCKIYLSLLHSQLRRKMGRDPSAGELYAAYNLGVRGFERRGFQLDKTPEITQRAIVKLHKHLK